MENISEREYILTVRGDIAIIALRAVLNSLYPALETNLKTANQLKSVQANQPPTNQPTLLSVVTQVADQNSIVLNSVISTIKQCLVEIDFLSGRNDIDNDQDTAITNIVNAIRSCSEVYADKSDEEIKKIIGL